MRTNEDSLKPTGFDQANLDWNKVKENIDPAFWQRLRRVNFNGSTGDNMTHPQIADIIDDVCGAVNSDCVVHVCTNGSLRNTEWWRALGARAAKYPNLSVVFGIDGLSDTHHLHRVGTDFDKIVANARAFIEAGGRAEWQMILFQHNLHQVEECRALSQDLGFVKFFLRSENRFHAGETTQKVYWRGRETHTIEYPGRQVVESLMDHTDELNDYSQHQPKVDLSKKIQCRSQNIGWLSLYADGTVWPCCWTMGWSYATHLSQQRAVNYHFKQVIGLDAGAINVYNNKLMDIINSDVWQRSWPDSIRDLPNPICVQQCSR